ncbi:hypothetical protein [Singulisphaera sp. PoT]|uniref:hypothetical protein n=1 Tax=Singulisphaera sp. PoT TaxID=3411797 RepID=UPI003BF4B556
MVQFSGSRSFQRLRTFRTQPGERPTTPATRSGVGESGPVRSQRTCQWVFSNPERQAR